MLTIQAHCFEKEKAGAFYFIFYPGHPLFQGVSHDLPTVLLSFLACPSLFGPSIVLASSNQRLAIRRRLIIMRARLLGRGC